MTIAELCARVNAGTAKMSEREMYHESLSVVVNPEDFAALETEFRGMWGAYEHAPDPAGKPRVFGYPIEIDARLKPGEIRLRIEVLV